MSLCRSSSGSSTRILTTTMMNRSNWFSSWPIWIFLWMTILKISKQFMKKYKRTSKKMKLCSIFIATQSVVTSTLSTYHRRICIYSMQLMKMKWIAIQTNYHQWTICCCSKATGQMKRRTHFWSIQISQKCHEPHRVCHVLISALVANRLSVLQSIRKRRANYWLNSNQSTPLTEDFEIIFSSCFKTKKKTPNIYYFNFIGINFIYKKKTSKLTRKINEFAKTFLCLLFMEFSFAISIFASRFWCIHFANSSANFLAKLFLSFESMHFFGQFLLFEFLNSQFRLLFRFLLFRLVIGLDHFHHVGNSLFMRRLNHCNTITVDRFLWINWTQLRSIFVRQALLQFFRNMQWIKLFGRTHNFLWKRKNKFK